LKSPVSQSVTLRLLLVLVLFGARSSKKPQAPLLQIGSGWNLTVLCFK